MATTSSGATKRSNHGDLDLVQSPTSGFHCEFSKSHFDRIRQESRYTTGSSGVQCEELGGSDRRSLVPSAIDPIRASTDTRISPGKRFPITNRTNNEENRGAIQESFARHGGVVRHANGNKDDGEEEEDARGQSASVVSDDDEEYSSWSDEDFTHDYHSDGVPWVCPIPLSSHRDGSICKGTYHWRKEFRIADRNETRLEAMMLSDPSRHCILNGETCMVHRPSPMWQVFSLKLAKIHVDCGSVELYGYIAARDHLDPLLNYIVNISRDEPVTVEQGSLIEMTGPKRGIDLSRTLLIEYDMRIKKGDREEDDLQLIDGAAVIDEIIVSAEPLTKRIHGDYGAVDMIQMCVRYAVEATMEVLVSEVQCSFNLRISCFTSGFHDEEIRLFDGTIGESRGLRRHVIAVRMGTAMDLKFKIGSGSCCSAEHCLSFKATNHGSSSQEINIELASILVKVSWSTLNYFPR